MIALGPGVNGANFLIIKNLKPEKSFLGKLAQIAKKQKNKEQKIPEFIEDKILQDKKEENFTQSLTLPL